MKLNSYRFFVGCRNFEKPTKVKFIKASSVFSTKSLSKSITSLFKLFFKQIDHCNKQSRFFSRISSFSTILNIRPVINSINDLHKHNKAPLISCFKFSILYTKISQNKLIKVLNKLTDFCFKGVNKNTSLSINMVQGRLNIP